MYLTHSKQYNPRTFRKKAPNLQLRKRYNQA
jgi:hypothetical protein